MNVRHQSTNRQTLNKTYVDRQGLWPRTRIKQNARKIQEVYRVDELANKVETMRQKPSSYDFMSCNFEVMEEEKREETVWE